ncbi:hypothetical protein BH18ACT14_BH18ACT14_15900 [soil metagenome]
MGNLGQIIVRTGIHIPGDPHNAEAGMPSTLITADALLYAEVDCGEAHAQG